MHFSKTTTTPNARVERKIFSCALLIALLLHVVVVFALLDVFKPQVTVVSLSSHRVSVSTQLSEPGVSTPVDSSPVIAQSANMNSELNESQVEQIPVSGESAVQESSASTVSKESIDQASQPVGQNAKELVPNLVAQEQELVEAVVTDNAAVHTLSKPPIDQKPSEEIVKKATAGVTETENVDRVESSSSELKQLTKQQPIEKVAETNDSQNRVNSAAQSLAVPVREPKFELGSSNNPEPDYPRRARKRGWEGDVVLGVHVDADGNVTYVEILESSHIGILDYAAHSTVAESWTFSPADETERDLKGYVMVPISFRIR